MKTTVAVALCVLTASSVAAQDILYKAHTLSLLSGGKAAVFEDVELVLQDEDPAASELHCSPASYPPARKCVSRNASAASQQVETEKPSCQGPDCLIAAAPAELDASMHHGAAPPSRVISFGPMTHSAFTRMVAKKRAKLAATLNEHKLAEVVISRKAAAATSESAFPSVDDLDGSILHAEPIPMPAPSQPAASCAAGSIPAPRGAGCVKLPSPTTPQADFTMEYEPMTPSPAPKKRTAAPTSTNSHADFTMEFEPMTPSPAPKKRAVSNAPQADFTMEFEPMTPSPAPSSTTATNTTTTTSVLGAIRKLRTQEEAEAEEREAMRRSPATQVVGSTQWRNRVAKEQHQRQQARGAMARTGADANAAASSSSPSSGTSSSISTPRGGVSGSSKLDKARGRADEAAIAAGLKAGPMPAGSRPVGQAARGKGQVQPKGAKGGRSAMPAASRPVRSAAEEVPKSLLDKFGRPKGTGWSSSRSA